MNMGTCDGSEVFNETPAQTPELDWLRRLRLSDVVAAGWALYGPAKDGDSLKSGELDDTERKIASKLVSLLDQFDITSEDGLYIFRLNAIASSFARGILGARHVLTERREQAREVKDISLDRVAAKIGWEVMARAAVQLFLLGGFSYVASYVILGRTAVPQELQSLMALLTALGSMLLGMAGQMSKIETKQREVEAIYYRALDEAKEKQCDKLLASLDRAKTLYHEAFLERYNVSPDELSMSLTSDIRTINLLRDIGERNLKVFEPAGLIAGIRKVIRSIILLGHTRKKNK